MEPASLLYLPLMLLAFLAVTYGIGRKALLLFKLELDELEEYLIATALGAGFLIFLTLLLAVTHLLYREVFIVIGIAAILFSTREVKQLLRNAKRLVASDRQRLKLNTNGILMLAYISFIASIGVATLAPVSEFDSLSYHMAFAKTYAGSHSFVYQPTQTYTTMPQGMTMLYTIAELFRAPNLSNMIAYSFGILASLAIYSIVRKRHSETAALTASLIFFTAPAIIERLPQATVDTSVTYFFLAAVIVMLKYAETQKTADAALTAILIGTATTIKLTGLFLAASAGIGVTLSWLFYKKRMNLKHAAMFGAIVILLASPWLALSYAYTGNPLYPQAQSVFGGKYLDESLTQLYANYHKSVGLDRTMINTLIVPWNITFNSKPFGPVIGLTPFFIMIMPLALIFWRRLKEPKAMAVILATGLSILMIQFWVHPVIRYMFPGIALLSIATGMITDSMTENRLLRTAIFTMLIVSLAFSAAIWYGINAKNVHYIASGETDAEYYAGLKDHNSYGAQQWVNANTPKDAVVMLFNEPRGYFLDRQYIMSSPHQTYIDYGSMNSTGQLLQRLRELRVSHILINGEFFDTYSHSAKGSSHPNALLRNLTKEYGELAYAKGQIMAYKIVEQ